MRPGATSTWPRLRGAGRVGARAAQAEAQPGGRFSSDGVMPGICRSGRPAVAARHRADQALRVGMRGPIEHVVDRAVLDDAAGIHDADLVGEPGDHRQVVRDPDQRRAGLAAQLLHLEQDLRPGW